MLYWCMPTPPQLDFALRNQQQHDVALSLFGQTHIGHIMKTQSTSDSMCTERMVKSSLPLIFILDDPKSPDDIGELLISIYDGGLSGNMRKGLRRPRSIPLICSNFSVKSIQRYL